MCLVCCLNYLSKILCDTLYSPVYLCELNLLKNWFFFLFLILLFWWVRDLWNVVCLVRILFMVSTWSFINASWFSYLLNEASVKYIILCISLFMLKSYYESSNFNSLFSSRSATLEDYFLFPSFFLVLACTLWSIMES